MAKMFYSLEEAAEKLGRSTDQVREMAASGQLQEFRDRDRLMFKREQVDLLSGGGDDDIIPLADGNDLEPLSLASSGSGVALGGEKESTGISIFDAEGTDEADANAVTRVTNAPGSFQDPGDKSASGSGGLLDLTREGDDTSLGANLLEDVYGSDTIAQQTSAETAIGGGGEALFESGPGGDTSESSSGMPAMVAMETLDGPWSGISGGLAIGSALAVLVAMAFIILSMTGQSGGMISSLGDQFIPLAGALLGLLVLFSFVGWFIGRKG